MTSQASLENRSTWSPARGARLREFVRQNRTRLLKSAIALLALLPCGWSVARALIVTSTTEASVVADTLVLRTPIAGVLRLTSLSTGDIVQTGRVLASVRNPRVDNSHETELSAKIRSLDGEIGSAEGSIRELEAFLLTLKNRGNKHARFRSMQLDAELREAESKIAAKAAILDEASTRLERANSMLSRGVSSQELASERERERTVAAADLDAARRHLEALTVEYDSMGAGLTLDGFSDRPYSMQRVDEVELSLLRQRTTLREQVEHRRALAVELQEEGERLAKLTHAEVATPRAGRVLRVLTSNGEYVNAGQGVVEIVECSKLSVVARLSKRDYARVHLGTRATFEPLGSDELMEGMVVQKLGQADPTHKLLSVVVNIPSLGARLGPQCEVGLPGELAFDTW